MTKAEEMKLRRLAMRKGLCVMRSPVRDPHAVTYDRYMVVRPESRDAVFGAEPRPYAKTAQEVRDYLARVPAESVAA